MLTIKLLSKLFFTIILGFLFYIMVSLAYGYMTDFVPKKIIPLSPTQQSHNHKIIDSIFTITTWNIGYAGMGKESDFFFDGGNILRSNGM